MEIAQLLDAPPLTHRRITRENHPETATANPRRPRPARGGNQPETAADLEKNHGSTETKEPETMNVTSASMTADDLRDRLARVDRRGYPAYKDLAGAYEVDGIVLSIDHVQGDPFAAPSSVSVTVPARLAGWERSLRDTPWRRTALEDLLLRRFGRALAARSFRVGGSGKSGLLATSRPGPEVLPRSALEIAANGDVLARFEAGFPARGRTTDARALGRMLLELVPDAVDEALICDGDGELGVDARDARGGDPPHGGSAPETRRDCPSTLAQARAAADLADDRHAVREQLERLGLVAFVADGSVLPRESGVSARPLRGALPFRSPESLRVTLDLPHRGPTPGMGVRRGVTLIVGGGYHGKSTLLRALQEGVYDHVAGDGRELAITCDDAVKLRAEDGRAVRDADISLFIRDLPSGADTRRFSTEDASGSTSQAANLVEAVEAGSQALLIDEDTSATNFMVRDRLMEAVTGAGADPITPFAERVRDLWETGGVSSVIVAGSSGAFFSVADTVVQMDRYEVHDITAKARAVCEETGADETPRAAGFAMPGKARPCSIEVAGEDGDGRRGHGGRQHGNGGRPVRVKVRVQGRDEIHVGAGRADMRLVEQLVDREQAATIGELIRAGASAGLLDGSLSVSNMARELLGRLQDQGWGALGPHGRASCGLALPRAAELAAALNRWRS